MSEQAKKDLATISSNPDDFLVIELDDRLEFGAVVIDDGSFNDTGCNSSGCSQNGYKC